MEIYYSIENKIKETASQLLAQPQLIIVRENFFKHAVFNYAKHTDIILPLIRVNYRVATKAI